MKEFTSQFATSSRIHMGLGVKDLAAAIAFYRTLFGTSPNKLRPRYARFEVAEPPLNLALNEIDGMTGPNNSVAHFGIQVKSAEAVRAMAQRLKGAGLEVVVEVNATCCYAVQDKVWATDPDGNKWETYVVRDDDAERYTSGACCANTLDAPCDACDDAFCAAWDAAEACCDSSCCAETGSARQADSKASAAPAHRQRTTSCC